MTKLLTEAAADSSLIDSPFSESSEPVPAKRPIFTHVIPRDFVILDAEVREGFLSDDLEKICAAATQSGATILVATAGAPLKDRENSFQLWRKSRLEKLHCEGLREFLSNNADSILSTSFREGTVDLLVLDAAIQNEFETKSREAAEQRKAAKEKLRQALWNHCEGISIPQLPQHLVVRGDGELKLVKNLNKAKEWGRIGNTGYYTVPLQVKDFRLVLPVFE